MPKRRRLRVTADSRPALGRSAECPRVPFAERVIRQVGEYGEGARRSSTFLVMLPYYQYKCIVRRFVHPTLEGKP